MASAIHPRVGGPALPRLSADADIVFAVPSKRINDGDDLAFFLSSIAYRDLMTWLLQLNRSAFPTRGEGGEVRECRLLPPPPFSPPVGRLRALLSDLKALIPKAPPDPGPRRFGNVAFRTWLRLVEEQADTLLEAHVGPTLDSPGNATAAEGSRRDLYCELRVYLLGGFGNAQRLDYGTGHELSFLAFLACLWKLSVFSDGDERGIVIGVIQPYLELVRSLVLTYTLEPAGSHGVWGLDDHSFAPYIFGSAQLAFPRDATDLSRPVPTEGSLETAPSPSSVVDRQLVADLRDTNMYFSAIQFIYDVKRGPFWEHSPVLYDISGIKDGWAKINKGMLKMYAAEVLGKFPVVQHFPFGSLFPWEPDPDSPRQIASVHARQQPMSTSVPPGPALASSGSTGVGTRAPWAKPASTGVPSARVPWTGSRGPPDTNRPTPSSLPPGMVPTVAPWAKKADQG